MQGNQQITKFTFLFFLLACSISALGQRKNVAPVPMMAGNSASGTLTVTATVVTSVGVITGEDGQQRIVIANASDAADNVSHFVMLTNQDNPAAQSEPEKRQAASLRTSTQPKSK